MSSQSLEGMVSSLLAGEKRENLEASDVGGQHDLALYSKEKMNKTKGSTKCFYCHKYGHIVWNCRTHARDLLKGKEIANTTNLDDFSELDSDEGRLEQPLKLF